MKKGGIDKELKQRKEERMKKGWGVDKELKLRKG